MCPEPDPIPNDSEPVAVSVIRDIEQRMEIGLATYKTYLQPFNGRDALWDAYEEALDLAIYLRQAIIERDMSS